MLIVTARLKIFPRYQDDSYDIEGNTYRFYGANARDKALVKAQEFKNTNKRIFLETEERVQ